MTNKVTRSFPALKINLGIVIIVYDNIKESNLCFPSIVNEPPEDTSLKYSMTAAWCLLVAKNIPGTNQ